MHTCWRKSFLWKVAVCTLVSPLLRLLEEIYPWKCVACFDKYIGVIVEHFTLLMYLIVNPPSFLCARQVYFSKWSTAVLVIFVSTSGYMLRTRNGLVSTFESIFDALIGEVSRLSSQVSSIEVAHVLTFSAVVQSVTLLLKLLEVEVWTDKVLRKSSLVLFNYEPG